MEAWYEPASGGNSYTWYAMADLLWNDDVCNDGDGDYPCGDDYDNRQPTPDQVDIPIPDINSLSDDSFTPGASVGRVAHP